MNERVFVNNRDNKNKRKNFNNGPKQSGDNGGNKPYGNSYGKKGQSNNISFLHNDELRASMWQTHGFIVDKNLVALGHMLQDKGIDCLVTNLKDSEVICSKALEQDRVFVTCNLKLFNKKSVMNRCCVHFKDNPYK